MKIYRKVNVKTNLLYTQKKKEEKTRGEANTYIHASLDFFLLLLRRKCSTLKRCFSSSLPLIYNFLLQFDISIPNILRILEQNKLLENC